MPKPLLRAHGRALPVWSALAIAPVLLTGALTFASRASSAAQDATAAKKDDKTYTIARAYKANETNRYKLNVNTLVNNPQLGGEVNIVLAMALKETVKSIKDDGTTTLQSEFDSASFKMGENEQDITGFMPTVITTLDKQGHVVDTKLEGGNPQFTQGPGAQMFNSISQQGFYPSKPVKVGDSWKIETTSKDKNAPKVNGTATLVGVETVDGMSTLKIKTVSDSETSFENPMNPGEKLNVKAHSEGITNVDTATGKLVKTTATTTSEGGPFGKSKVETTFTLVKGDGKDKPEKADKKADTKG